MFSGGAARTGCFICWYFIDSLIFWLQHEIGSSEILRFSHAKHAGTHVQCLLKRFFLFPAQKNNSRPRLVALHSLGRLGFQLVRELFFLPGGRRFSFYKKAPLEGRSFFIFCFSRFFITLALIAICLYFSTPVTTILFVCS